MSTKEPASFNNSARRRVVAMALVSVVVLALCVSNVSRSTPVSAASTPKSGCGSTSPGSTTLSLVVRGLQRTVIVHVPKSAGGRSPLALVLNLHGSGSTALVQEELTKMNGTANADGFIVAYPQALFPDGTGFDWNVPGVPLVHERSVKSKARNDVKFLTLLVGILEQKYCVNAKKVYATGFSGGAREASQLACDDSSIFAAVAPVSGLRRPTPCPTNRAVSVISFHGLLDKIDPFAGRGEKYWTYSVPSAARLWAEQDHCATKATASTPAKGVKLITYSSCAGGAIVELYNIMGEGHEWPGGPALPSSITSLLGPQSNAVSANALMWSFFVAHPLS